MRTTVKELKKWLENIEDDAIISTVNYKNKREKNFIVATSYKDDGKTEEREYLVSVEDEFSSEN